MRGLTAMATILVDLVAVGERRLLERLDRGLRGRAPATTRSSGRRRRSRRASAALLHRGRARRVGATSVDAVGAGARGPRGARRWRPWSRRLLGRRRPRTRRPEIRLCAARRVARRAHPPPPSRRGYRLDAPAARARAPQEPAGLGARLRPPRAWAPRSRPPSPSPAAPSRGLARARDRCAARRSDGASRGPRGGRARARSPRPAPRRRARSGPARRRSRRASRSAAAAAAGESRAPRPASGARAPPPGRWRPALDDAGEEVARAAEPAARPGALTLVLGGAPDDLVDELGLREHAGPRDAKPLRLLDQLLPRHPLEILPVHRGGPYHRR